MLLGGAAACAADGFWIEPNRLTISRHDIRLPHLPPGLDGLRIGVMADFHHRPGLSETVVAKAVAVVAREDLDLVMLPGDFINSSGRVLAPLLEQLSGLTARHGVFASMGNHDGWHAGRDLLRRSFERAGIAFLINSNSQLTIRGERLAVAGTDFVWHGRPDPAVTLRGIRPEAAVIALVHEPDYFDTMAARRRIDLQLSGHTHGGQCRIPLIPYTPKKVRYGRKYVQGSFANGDSRLFVTRGVGTTGLRVRFACPPELAILTLRAPI